jgi:hypothetical protein
MECRGYVKNRNQSIKRVHKASSYSIMAALLMLNVCYIPMQFFETTLQLPKFGYGERDKR